MEITTLDNNFSVSGQLSPEDFKTAAEMGFKTIINNRPDGEAQGQPTSLELAAAARAAGLAYHYVPVKPGDMPAELVSRFRELLGEAESPVLAFCRTGNRSSKMHELAHQFGSPNATGAQRSRTTQVVIVGAGAGGLATAASLLKRAPGLAITVIDPSDNHAYQPGWTMVGAGIFRPGATIKPMAAVIPEGVTWLQNSVTAFEPEKNRVQLATGEHLQYEYLVVSPGIKLDWDQVDGLRDTLGQHGVTSNYHFDCAPRTWEFVQNLKEGNAVFTQPPMPIKCAGAPQKALYLSADHWLKSGHLGDINIDFYNAGGVLFGVQDYVPALDRYIEKYNANLHYNHNLVAVDGPAGKAWFEGPDGRVEKDFDFLHVAPPQTAPDFIKASPLASEAGWVDVDQQTLRHTRFDNVFGLGDCCSAPNAKTAAAVRKQAPVVAHNLLAAMRGEQSVAHYDGYGSCPLIVERGKVVLAEFGYGGKILPSVPTWLLNGKTPTRLAWILKTYLLPPIYFKLMLKGHEWLAAPEITTAPVPSAATQAGV